MNFLRHYIPLGSPIVDGSNRQVQAVLKRVGAGWTVGACLMHGAIQNLGTTNFTFAILESDDNAVADAYAAVTIRVKGANVTTVTVKPGAVVEFTIEYAAAFNHSAYLAFCATPTAGVALGMLGLVYREEANVEFLSPRNAVGV